MQNNDFFRRLRYALDLKDNAMLNLFREAKHPINQQRLLNFLKKDDEYGYEVLSNAYLSDFLDALIIEKRGASDKPMPPYNSAKDKLTNNMLLKKLRIALILDEEKMLATFAAGGVELSTSELRALFRKPGSRQYRPCGDQWLRPFLAGLRA
jgi:uncharacterized protein YehS (DUF1456 family)